MSQWKPRLPRLLPPSPLQLSVKNGRPDNDCELVSLVRPNKTPAPVFNTLIKEKKKITSVPICEATNLDNIFHS